MGAAAWLCCLLCTVCSMHVVQCVEKSGCCAHNSISQHSCDNVAGGEVSAKVGALQVPPPTPVDTSTAFHPLTAPTETHWLGEKFFCCIMPHTLHLSAGLSHHLSVRRCLAGLGGEGDRLARFGRRGSRDIRLEQRRSQQGSKSCDGTVFLSVYGMRAGAEGLPSPQQPRRAWACPPGPLRPATGSPGPAPGFLEFNKHQAPKQATRQAAHAAKKIQKGLTQGLPQ